MTYPSIEEAIACALDEAKAIGLINGWRIRHDKRGAMRYRVRLPWNVAAYVDLYPGWVGDWLLERYRAVLVWPTPMGLGEFKSSLRCLLKMCGKEEET